MSDGLSNPRSSSDVEPARAVSVQRPHPARIASVNRLGHTRIELDQPSDLALKKGESVLVHGFPPANRSTDIATATAVTTTAVEIAHPFGPVGRRVWVRRPS